MDMRIRMTKNTQQAAIMVHEFKCVGGTLDSLQCNIVMFVVFIVRSVAASFLTTSAAVNHHILARLLC